MANSFQSDGMRQQRMFSLLEEATHLLRRVPAAAWLGYYAGTAPLVVYGFYFWSDMSRAANAKGHLAEMALVWALLFGWMKCWHAVFGGQLMRLLEARDEMAEMPGGGWWRLAGGQVLIHATMPVVLPLALLALAPFGWVYAFYHNVSALALGHFQRGGTLRGLVAAAVAQSHCKAVENHWLIVVIGVTALLVYLNVFTGLALGLMLAKSFTGTENAFSMNPLLLLSSSFQVLLVCVGYLVMNPLVKAVYALRCFYGVSRKSGADLEARLRVLPGKTGVALMLLMMGCCLAEARSEEVAAGKAGGEGGLRLAETIREVLQDSEYQWRMPREADEVVNDDSWLVGVVQGVVHWFRDAGEVTGRFFNKFWDWLFQREPRTEVHIGGDAATGWTEMLPRLLLGLAVLMLVALAWLIYRHWDRSKKAGVLEAGQPLPVIDLEAEGVVASQLPEEGWLDLAREKGREGERRLALRAFFLATLAYLGERRLLIIGKSKSNGDYVRELGWRARGREDLCESFREQVRVFDAVWYGWHEVSEELMRNFEEQHERTRQHAV